MTRRLFVNAKVCTGCRYCEVVCSIRHEGKINPRKSRIKVKSDLLGGRDTPKVCHQCDNPPCVSACPVSAIIYDSVLNTPIINSEKCDGCKTCIDACPFKEIFFDDEQNVAIKCDLCGGDPQCVKFCRALPHIGHAALTYTTIEVYKQAKQAK